MNTCFLNVLLDGGNNAGGFVSQRINIKLSGAFEKLIDQNGPVRRKPNCRAYVFVQALVVVNDGHCSATQNITWPHQDWITDFLSDLLRFFRGGGHSVVRLWDSQLSEQRAKALAVFREIDCVSCGSDDRHTRLVQT